MIFLTVAANGGIVVDKKTALEFEGPLSPTELRVPARVELMGDTLEFTYKSPVRRVVPGNTLFSDFIALADAKQERVLAFARRWGVLEICDHLLPAGHDALT